MSISGTTCYGSLHRWDAYGIPCPSVDQFSYTVDAGLIRTPMDTGHYRQRRRYSNRPTFYDLSWRVTTPQLHAVESFVQEKGYDWFLLPMVTGQQPLFEALDYPLRFISDLSVSIESTFKVDERDEAIWNVTIQAEQYDVDTACALDLMCATIRECLQAIKFGRVSINQFLPITPIDPTGAVAAWGTWSNING
jgi:hypothetical protein